MTEINIGKIIASLRKDKKVTQESLADAVGVTPQAVSKWETGASMPDIWLLPAVADYFDVSTDTLYGRKNTGNHDMKNTIKSLMSSVEPMEKRLDLFFEWCWNMELSMFDRLCDEELEPLQQALRFGKDQWSQMLLNNGFTSLRMDEYRRYFLIMPEPAEGWRFENIDKYKSFFADMAEEGFLRLIMHLYKTSGKPFTKKSLLKRLESDENELDKFLDKLSGYKLISCNELELDDEITKYYTFRSNPALIPLLTMVEEIIDRPCKFYCNAQNRSKPYIN